MNTRLFIVLIYLLATLGIGALFRKSARKSSIEFFLAGRNLNRVLLFFTMAATNFSAFTIFGFSGAGYRIGYSFYPVMGFGTGFMALSFFIIGDKILILSRKRNYIIPSDFIQDRYNSPFLKKLFSMVMIIFTLPYIALQAIASGKSLNSLIGISYLAGALLITGFVVTYVVLGGLRSIVWTDFFQGFLMIAFTLAAFIIIAERSGGFVHVHKKILSETPALFSRPGVNGSMGFGIWIGYMVLWFFADPMFPQLFQRFMVAKDRKTLHTTVILYPIITTFLFFLTVSIGVMGRASFPSLEANMSDTIFPLLLGQYTNVFLGTLLLTGSIAALMSTMDSQLLTLTSMITIDFLKIEKNEILKEKITIIVIGAVSFLIALKPPSTILDFISRSTFNGLSVLGPCVLGGLYWKKANKFGAVASIFTGEIMVIAYYFEKINVPGLHPIIPILGVAGSVFIIISALTSDENDNKDIVFSIHRKSLLFIPIFILIFILGNDFWNWGKTPVLSAGLPLWIWYFIGLGVLLSAVYGIFLRRTES